MLRRLAIATAKRHHQHHAAFKQRSAAILIPQQLACCLSTAPRPQQQQPISVSYQEWAAKNAASQSQSRDQKNPTPRVRQSSLQQQQPRRIKPRKYNSLVYLPDTVSLQFPHNSNNNFQLDCVDFAIAKPGSGGGGHAVLGRNGSGKSLLVQRLVNDENARDDNDTWTLPPAHNIAYVSFDSHLQVLRDHPNQTVHDAITGGGRGNLSKAAQYLVVRFGLFPILHRTLSTLSTGEIRKTLLVSALAQQPQLLVLENPFDGLDVASRQELSSIVSKSLQGLGKSGKLLVQGVNADYVPPAQVLLSTHRPEEIVPEISTVSYIEEKNHANNNNNTATNNNNNNTLWTISRPSNYSQEQIMFMALGLDKDHNKNTQNWSVVAPWDDPDPTLPSPAEIQQVWPATEQDDPESTTTLLALEDVTIRRRRDGGLVPTGEEVVEEDGSTTGSEYATLLHSLNWDIQQGQRWVIAGGNGAGKSTLTRFLLQTDNNKHGNQQQQQEDDLEGLEEDTTKDLIAGTYHKQDDTTIGWVSTESHLGQVVGREEGATAWDVICHNGQVPQQVAETMISWVFGGGADNSITVDGLKERSLHDLSQGEQKLALIASALTLRPKLLILDEPSQGLDWVHRRRILGLLERLCNANPDLSLAFITHYQEEWIPSISHVLHLDQGRVLYQGKKKQYNPEKL